MKFIENQKRKEKDNMWVPKSVQDAIPIKRIYTDGIFYLGNNKYSKTFKFTDINFAIANNDDKESMFLKYSSLLNSFDSGTMTKITIMNRRLDKINFEKEMLFKKANDGLNLYRDEYNKILLDNVETSNRIIQEKFITTTVEKKNILDARMYFSRTGTEIANRLSELNSKCIELDCNERLRLLHDFYRTKEESDFIFDIKNNMRKGHDFKDYISPDTMEIKKDYIKIGDRYARVLFLKDYATFIKDSMITELTDLNKNLILSIDVLSVPMDEAVREAEMRRLGVETNITNWQRRQNNNNNFSAVIPYDLEQQRQESKEFLDDLITRDQRMFLCVMTLVHTADTKEELDNDTEILLSTGRKHLCQLSVLKYQQLEGLNTVLPIGHKKLNTLRTLTTESLSVFVPFRVQQVYDKEGIYYGQNVISKNMIIADRRKLLNGNSFILGVSGSGKSFTAKQEITSIMLREPDADIVIIDPEAEYKSLVTSLGGEVINISATSKNHINAMDINAEYGGDGKNPIILKSEFILTLCNQLMGVDDVESRYKSIIDRCTVNVYKKYQQENYKTQPPTLKTFREELLKQKEQEAKDIALAIELFTDGSLDTFAKQTNVNVNNRLICYDILELGKQLQPAGMLVILDSIFNRITMNRAKGKNTYIFIDEIYLLFEHEYSANFLFTLWKRVRKYGAFCTRYNPKRRGPFTRSYCKNNAC